MAETIRPSSDYSCDGGMTKVGGSTCWECVLTDSDSKYVSRTYPPYLDQYQYILMRLGDLTVPYSSISKVTIHSIVRGNNAVVKFKYRVYTHSSLYTTPELDGTQGGTDVSYDYTTNPYTGLAWSVDEVNDLIAGIGLVDTGIPSGKWVDYFYVVVTGTEGSAFPSVAITRVTNIIHRYTRKNQTYTMECSLGGVTSDFGLPEWTSKPRLAVPESDKELSIPEPEPIPEVPPITRPVCIDGEIKGSGANTFICIDGMWYPKIDVPMYTDKITSPYPPGGTPQLSLDILSTSTRRRSMSSVLEMLRSIMPPFDIMGKVRSAGGLFGRLFGGGR